jgi:AbrB family looped-hinge helix DNA binding protein
MVTKISANGEVVIPSSIRRELGLQPGDSLEARVEGQDIVLTPRKVRARKARIVRDPITGLPVLTAGPKAPRLLSVEVIRILNAFM